VIDERNAFIMNTMLQDVVNAGTGARAKSLGRSDLAGKTGTTNDYVDAWFCGYNPDVVTVAWVGFDQPSNLGRGETGGRTALPIWIDYMKVALNGVKDKPLVKPARVSRVAAFDGMQADWVYAENDPPIPPELPDDLLEHATAPMDAPSEMIPAFPSGLFGEDSEAPPQAPIRIEPRAQPPAPVEDLAPVPAPVLEAAPRPLIRSTPMQ